DAVEVWNGEWTAEEELSLASWEAMLREGGDWLPAMGNSDAHRACSSTLRGSASSQDRGAGWSKRFDVALRLRPPK
ncbi:hypothetical protein, partial [Streptomyces hainanensis]